MYITHFGKAEMFNTKGRTFLNVVVDLNPFFSWRQCPEAIMVCRVSFFSRTAAIALIAVAAAAKKR